MDSISKKFRIFVICMATVLLASACASTPLLTVDYDHQHDFTNYKTYAWISDDPMMLSGDRAPNPVARHRIMPAIEQTLELKGFRKVSRSRADFVVSFTVGARDQLNINTTDVVGYYGPQWTWGHGYYGYNHGRYAGQRAVEVIQYAEGTLAIDVFDVNKKSPVWHGSATKKLTQVELEIGKGIPNAIRGILANFPPSTEAPVLSD